MLIREIGLAGFLSFGPGSKLFALEPLNVLIGPNGSGKSNFIEALSVLSATPTDMAKVIGEGGGAERWVWQGEPSTSKATIEVVLGSRRTPTRPDFRYRLEFGSDTGQLNLLDEVVENANPYPGKDDANLYYRYQDGRPVINVREKKGCSYERGLKREDLRPDESVLAQRKDPDSYPEVTWVGEQFAGFRFLRDWALGRHAPPRKWRQADLPTDHLLPDCSNLALILNSIYHSGENRVSKLLRRFYPRFERLSTGVFDGTLQPYLRETGLVSPTPAVRLSNGTLRYMALLAALYAPSPPSLLCIEEPEIGLHPDSIALLGEVLIEASKRMQLVVTTHSGTLISALSDQPSAVVVCERPHSSTVLRRLDPERVDSWLDELLLGDLWYMGELGGNP